MAQQLANPASIHERCRFDPWPCSVGQGSGVAVSCGVGRNEDPALLWLWHRPVATVPIGPLAWEPPYAAGATLKERKKKNHIMFKLQKIKSRGSLERSQREIATALFTGEQE